MTIKISESEDCVHLADLEVLRRIAQEYSFFLENYSAGKIENVYIVLNHDRDTLKNYYEHRADSVLLYQEFDFGKYNSLLGINKERFCLSFIHSSIKKVAKVEGTEIKMLKETYHSVMDKIEYSCPDKNKL